MKKNVFALLLVLITALSLFSCDEGVEGMEDTSGYVFAPGVESVIIFSNGISRDMQTYVYQSLKTATGQAPIYDNDESEAVDHEIVIGDCDRAISRKAYRKLRTIAKTTDDYKGYVIYASGNSVAIAYDEDYDNLAMTEAVEYFIENYIKGKTSLKLAAGVVYSDVFNPISYYEEIDAVEREAKWKALEEYVGGEAGKNLVTALKSFYETYDEGVVTWMANLYDPFICHCGECVPGTLSCGGGGFYYSNSARDNEGYAADIESTAQALSFLTKSGLADMDGGHYRYMIPDFMKEQIVVYLRSLQYSNGFFYNYQWSQADTDAHVLRRARDLGSAVSVLQNLGSGPKYDTPLGHEGIGDSGLGGSVSALVSKVVLSADYNPDFENKETMLAYLERLYDQHMPVAWSGFYAIGSEITSQMGQIIQRDKDAGTYGTPDSIVTCVIDWFNSHQRADNGLWGDLNYNGVNGLLKISGIYLNAGVLMNYPKEATLSAIEILNSDEVAGSAVNVYNAWSSIQNVINNLIRFGGDQAIIDDLVSSLYAVAPEALYTSAVKVSGFEKPDGSFSYGLQYSSATSQGMPVAVPNSVEGDVNGTLLNMTGLLEGIYGALQLTDYAVPLFGRAERRMYLDVIYSLGPVQKITGDEDEGIFDYPLDFEDGIIGEPYEDLNVVLRSPGSSATVVKDTIGTSYGQVIDYRSNAGGGDFVYATNNGAKTNSCYVFEADLCVLPETINTYFMQIVLGDSYMISFTKESGTRVRVYESTTGDGKTAIYNTVGYVGVSEWFNLRIEYFCGDANTARIKVYLNGDLVAVSNNYMGKLISGASTTPVNDKYEKTGIYIMSGATSALLIDNLYATSTKDTYTPATEADDKVIYDIDNPAITPPEKPGTGGSGGGTEGGGNEGGGNEGGGNEGGSGEVVGTVGSTLFDFETETVGNAPTTVVVGTRSPGSSATVISRGEGKAMTLYSYPGGGDYINALNTGSQTASCYIFEGDILIGSECSNTYFMQLFFADCYMLGFRKGSEVTIFEATTGDNNTAIINDLIAVEVGKWFNLRVEYYRGSATTTRIKVYVNGALISISDNYLGKLNSGVTPAPNDTSYPRSQIYIMSGATAVVSVDNLYAGVSDETYTPATENDNPIYNIDKDKTEKPDDDTPKLPDTTPDVERDPGVNDFSGDEIGARPSGIDTRLESAGASVTVSMHASAPEKGNVVRFISNDGAGDNLFVMNNGATSGSCFVFEADMCIGADSSTYISHINVGNAYMFWIVKSGSSIIVRESTTTQNVTAVQKDLATFAFDEWFNIRVEYYHGDKETVRIKVYINDVLVSTSNNYYGKTQDGTDSGPIANQPEKTTVFAFKGGIHTIYLDNVYFGVTNDTYTED